MIALAIGRSGTGTSVMQLRTALASGSSADAHAGAADGWAPERAAVNRTGTKSALTATAAIPHRISVGPLMRRGHALPTVPGSAILSLLRRLTSLVHRRGDLSQCLTDDALDLVGRRRDRHVVHVDGERESLTLCRRHVAGEPLPRHEELAIERIFDGKGPRLREDVTGGRRLLLDVPQRSVLAEHRHGGEKRVRVRPFRHRAKEAHHECGREVRIATGPVTLAGARDVETECREELTLEVEAGRCAVSPAQRAEEK